ncbi:hypothetical protein ABI_09790 [Asticcacaulis biprosthecium C19]|uniref:Uncharacterized protein n=1 Tax=Asticcacaulis biprosthecium C19 TaxID=715226 RepID=F4QGU0_9CAUL|nr:hypothetical protein [Asticcacaulis biprosthecium]EGF92542.1 hypothetical protein ABI_09790 [Asticcacaulis biprosthecium C19]
MRIVTACLLAVSLCATPLSQAFAQTAATEVSDVSLSRARETIGNFHFFEATLVNLRASLDTHTVYSSWPKTDRDELYKLAVEALEAQRPAIVDAIAEAQVRRFTEGEWNQIAEYSRITYVQDLVLAGADPSRPRPDPSSMSRTDSAVFGRLAAQPFVVKFFTEFDPAGNTMLVEEALKAATTRLHGS